MESSTSMPMPSARPPSDMMFSDSPIWYMITKVATTEIGIDSAMTAVLRTSCRKKKMTRIASRPPCHALLSTSLMAPSMKVDWSKMVASVMPGGQRLLDALEARLDRPRDGDRVRVAFLVDVQADAFLAVDAGDDLAIAVAPGDLGHVVQHAPAGRSRRG